MKASELHIKLAEKVRADSKYQAKLTSAEGLQPVMAGRESGDIAGTLTDIAIDDETFRDIKAIEGPTGKKYFYSEMHMTQTYARILARVDAGDACLTIAETVREESRVYPRVTNVELFKYGLFKIDYDNLDQYVARVQELYDDIKPVRSRSGALYLYSSQYLTPDWAQYLAKSAEHVDS